MPETKEENKSRPAKLPSVKALREQLRQPANAIQQMRDSLHARNDGKPTAEWQDFNAEEKAAWDRANTEYNAIARQIEYAEAAEKVDLDLSSVVGDLHVGRGSLPKLPVDSTSGHDGAEIAVTEHHRSMALAAWCAVQMDEEATAEQLEACRIVGLNPNKKKLYMPLYRTQDYGKLQRAYRSVHPSRAIDAVADFHATLTTGSGPAGGYLVPPETLIRMLEINLLAYGGVRQVAETIRTTTGEPLSWPTADDTSNTGAQLGENTSIGNSVDPSFAKVQWGAYKFSSKPILVPYELIQDSAFDLPSLLGQMLGERLGRITNTKFTTGTGAATPKGIVVCSGLGVTTASATAITSDEIISLVHSVDPAYRQGAGFMMHDNILMAIRKLKDGNGQYMWQGGMQQGVPDRLFGYMMTINQDMQSSVASATKTMLFGQLSKYKIRTVGAVRMYRLEERYRDTDQDGFVAFLREDGNLLTAGTNPVKHMLQAT